MTLGTLLKQGREILQNAGIAEWDLDAWYLLEYVTGVSRSQYFLDPEREVPQEQEAAYRQMIDKRSTHIPLQHLTGEQEFMGLAFKGGTISQAIVSMLPGQRACRCVRSCPPLGSRLGPCSWRWRSWR